jgi:hypothetical protein
MLMRCGGGVEEVGREACNSHAIAIERWERRFGGRADALVEAWEARIVEATGPQGDKSGEEWRECRVRERRGWVRPEFRARGEVGWRRLGEAVRMVGL